MTPKLIEQVRRYAANMEKDTAERGYVPLGLSYEMAKALLAVDAVCKLHTIELSEENIADKEAIMAYGRLIEKIQQAIEESSK